MCAFANQLTSVDFALLEAADPWGEERADWRAALLGANTAAAAGVKKPRVRDYMLKFTRRGQSQRARDIARLEHRMAQQ